MAKLAAMIVVALATMLLAGSCGSAQSGSPCVRVESGELTGVSAAGVDSYKGVPYAAPPVGDLRWRSPRPSQPWKEARSAADYGHSCPQRSAPERVVPSSQAAITSEDCLTLNVWTPTQRPPKLLPVMVWIHGGGNNAGTSAQTHYDGSAFARDGVVLVSFNYRLGAFGFFAHPALTAAGDARANFGLLDQVAALHWIKRNIRAFGGDPDNMTAFGESAGGTDILLLMTARQAAGTFQKAIVESAGWWTHVPNLSEAQAAGAAIATHLGLPGAAATATQLRSVATDSLTALPDSAQLGPVIDHDLLTESPQSVFAHGRARHVPLIIGTNNNEGSLIPADALAAETVPELSKPDLGKVTLLYGAAAAGATTPAPLLFRDARFAMPSRWIAARASAGAPVFLYRFDYVVSFLSRRRTGANHGSEIPFVFATWPDFRLSEADQRMTRTLHGCWVAFAKTGAPVCPDAPAWPAYRVGSDVWMRFAAQVGPEPVSNRPVLDFLQSRVLPSPHE